MDDSPARAISQLPAGAWGVAVSGGADSVSLLRLVADRDDLRPVVIHLDHETRNGQSGEDAAFVTSLADSLRLPLRIATRSAVEDALPPADREALPANLSARFRTLRHRFFGDVLRSTVFDGKPLQGVLLAHHADDQAETVLLRLLRGAGYSALAGMAEQTEVGGVRLVRPLLGVRRDTLREYLRSIGQPWREDASNTSDDYARNRLRKLLATRPELTTALLHVAPACRALSGWVDARAPTLAETFSRRDVANLPAILADAAVARWLRTVGVAPDSVSPDHVHTIVDMCRDVASPARLTVPGGKRVRRRAGRVWVEPSLTKPG